MLRCGRLTFGRAGASFPLRGRDSGGTQGTATMADLPRLMRLRATITAAALVVAAPAAHAFTMNTMTNPGGAATYTDPADQLKDATKGKTTTPPGVGLEFSVGPSSTSPWGRGPSSSFGSGKAIIGAPPDQSKFNDR
jgi:hypothetical protein